MTNSTTFTQGTTITSAWLNDVNTKTFNDDASTVSYMPAGVGAVATTVEDQLLNIQSWSVNVKDAPFYAKGDGVTDDTAAIQAAINSQGTGGYVFIPKGDYLVTSQLIIPYSRFRLSGAGCFVTRLITNAAFNNSDGLVKLSGPGGPPTFLNDMCISGPTGGAGAISRGLNVAANGSFIKNVWVTTRCCVVCMNACVCCTCCAIVYTLRTINYYP